MSGFLKGVISVKIIFKAKSILVENVNSMIEKITNQILFPMKIRKFSQDSN